MIDPRLLREDPDRVRESQRRRGADPDVVDHLLTADARRRSAIVDFEGLRADQKGLGRRVAKAGGEDEKAALLEHAQRLAADVRAAQAAAEAAGAEWDRLLLAVDNLVDEAAPVGGEDDYALVETRGTPRDFAGEGFVPLDHLELGERLGAIDVQRGAKVSGARFYFLTGAGALLQLGLLQLAMAQAVQAGFVPVIPPVLVRPEAMAGTGYLGQAAADVYHLPADDLYLVGTSEVALAAYHGGEVLDGARLPLRYAGWSSCFRREAGSYGQDTRGILRVHQFDKVEMFSFCRPDDAAAEHQRLLAWQQEMLDRIDVPYRVIDVATGDLGASAVRKFDCEGWVPTQARYRELTSTSNCTTFQARRLGVRSRDGDARPAPVATLNGTLATTRWLVALLENGQQADGSVRVPVALRPYVGGREVLEPVR